MGWVARRSAKKAAPYVAMVLTELIAASYTTICKVIFTEGTNSMVFIVYQFVAATAFLAPLAYYTERKARPGLTLSTVCWMFLLALLGATMFQNLLSSSLYYISSTSQSAILNLFPATTYLLSVALRQEQAELTRLRGVAKLLGTMLSVAGASSLVFWRGGDLKSLFTSKGGDADQGLGFLLAALGMLSMSVWLVLQGPLTRRYPAELSITTMMYFFGTLQSGVLAALMCRRSSDWRLKWNLELLNIFFGGVVNSGIGSFVFIWCGGLMGPLFVAVFSPLMLLFSAIMETVFLGSPMHFESIIGSVMIVGGLYVFLWAKSMEQESDGSIKGEQVQAITSPLLVPTEQP